MQPTEANTPPESNNKSTPHVYNWKAERQAALLRKLGCLHGVRIDGNDGPRTATHPVAMYKSDKHYHSADWIIEKNGTFTETIDTANNRDASYVHSGWSEIAIKVNPPWVGVRTAKNQQTLARGRWTTKRIVFGRMTLDIPLDSLVPMPEFVSAIKAALGEPTLLERFQSLDRVFQFWGDVVPLVFDVGLAMIATSAGSDLPVFPDASLEMRVRDLPTRNWRFSIQAGNNIGYQEDLFTSFESADPDQWVQTGVARVIPVTDLLDRELELQLKDLYFTLLSYSPSYFGGVAERGGSFDGTHHAFRTISSISVQCAGLIHSIAVHYADGPESGQYGVSSEWKHNFNLRNGEFVTEVVVWRDQEQEALSGIQFMTSRARVSPHYGGHGGYPRMYNSKDGCLVGFCGRLVEDSQSKAAMIDQLQSIWRHDMARTLHFEFSPYLGGSGGYPFNDRAYFGDSDMASISSIYTRSRYDKSWYVESIRVEYVTKGPQGMVNVTAPCHGGSVGSEEVFHLENGERITRVLVRVHIGYISGLQLVTNLGHKSQPCGGEAGEVFEFEAPRDERGQLMGLGYILGKSSNWLHGLMFVWLPAQTTE